MYTNITYLTFYTDTDIVSISGDVTSSAAVVSYSNRFSEDGPMTHVFFLLHVLSKTVDILIWTNVAHCSIPYIRYVYGGLVLEFFEVVCYRVVCQKTSAEILAA